MADLIARFKGDTSDLDKKIKGASKELLQMKSDCEKVGGAFINLDKEQVKFIRDIGRMETGCKDAKSTVATLTKAFTDLSAMYNRLTDEEKKDEGGKALRASLSQLRDRIAEGKKELNDINGKIGDSGSALAKLSGQFGINIPKVLSWGSALTAGKAALDVVKDSLLTNEQNVDEWGRTVESATGLYNAFCQALNTGDLGGFFSNMERIIKNARDAYDALDNLKTMTGLISNQESMLNAQRAKFQKIIKDPKATQAEKDAARQGLLDVQKQKAGATEATKQLNNDHIKTQLRQQLGTLTDAEYQKYYNLIVRSFYDSAAKAQIDRTTVTHGKKIVGAGSNARSVDNVINIGDLLTDQFRESLNPYIQAYWNADARKWTDERADNRIIGGGGSSGGSGSHNTEIIPAGSIAEAQKKLQDLQKAWTDATTQDERDSLYAQIKKAEAELQMMKKPLEFKVKFIPEDKLTEGLTSGIPELPTNPLADVLDATGMGASDDGPGSSLSWYLEECRKKADELSKSGEDISQSWANAGNAIGSLGSALASIEDPAVKVFGIIAQAVAEVALSFAKSLKGTMTPWDWIAGAAAGTATMISTISAIKSATMGNYANGGIIPGNSYSGDNLRMYGVNSGEVVLNQAQTANLATKLNNNAQLRMNSKPYLDCEKIYLGINSYLGATGQGQLIVSRS